MKKFLEKNIKKDIENICQKYYELMNEDEIQDLIIIASFIIDFILILPFKEDNIKMAKILTLLLLNKSNYEVGRFTSLGEFFDDEEQLYSRRRTVRSYYFLKICVYR